MQRVDLTLVELVESSDRKEDIEALDEALVAFESLASGKAELVKSRTVRVSTKWRQLRRWGFRAPRRRVGELSQSTLAILGFSLFQVVEDRKFESMVRGRASSMTGQRSEVIAPSVEPIRPVLELHHPPLELRKLSINGGGATISVVSNTITRVILKPDLLGKRIQGMLFAKDGRECFFNLAVAVERARDTLGLSADDFAAAITNRALIEVIDDVEDMAIVSVSFPCKQLANQVLIIHEAPFHGFLGPVENHHRKVTCVPADDFEPSELRDHFCIVHELTVHGTEPVRISLRQLLKNGR